MNEVVTALPATFRGVKFRSRTEARWAVFMTSLGVEWHYEYEGYSLPSGNYLPDFWLEDPRIVQAVQESRSWVPPEGKFVR